jgi:hypothetical protein
VKTSAEPAWFGYFFNRWHVAGGGVVHVQALTKKGIFPMSKSAFPHNNKPSAKPPIVLPNVPPKRAAGSAETVPRTDHAPVVPTETSEALTAIVSKAHAYAGIVPMLPPLEFKALCDDIAKNGQLEPITMWDGLILDGRNRAAACKVLGIEPKTREFSGNNPLDYVISQNLRRRQSSKSQLAMIAVNMANLPAVPGFHSAISLEDAGELLGVSKRFIQHAHKVHTKAIPEVVALVESGKLPVDKAAKLTDATPEQQRDAVEAVKRGDKCPTFKPQAEEQDKKSSLKIQLVFWLKSAMEMPLNSQERVDALAGLFKEISAEAFGKNSLRKEFMQSIAAECVEYGVELPAAGTSHTATTVSETANAIAIVSATTEP